MTTPIVGKVLSIALRTSENGPMREVSAARAGENAGIDGDVQPSAERGITLLAAGQWRQVTAELGSPLPWHTRRANILVDAGGLGHLIGKTIRIGPVELRINAETKPCGLMDKLHAGLRAALKPDCRGGVYGTILRGGPIRVGDEIVLLENGSPEMTPEP